MRTDSRPCKGDATTDPDTLTCAWCIQPKYPGVSGYAFFLGVALEVAGERALRVRRLEGKLRSKQGETDLWAQAAGKRPHTLPVRDDWGWEE